MKWKFKLYDDGDEMWVARASPLVGRRYQIYTEWQGHFRVAYEDHDYEWHVLEGTWPTLAEAQTAAEADHARRKNAARAAKTRTRGDLDEAPHA
jgi:hypothetical protein